MSGSGYGVLAGIENELYWVEQFIVRTRILCDAGPNPLRAHSGPLNVNPGGRPDDALKIEIPRPIYMKWFRVFDAILRRTPCEMTPMMGTHNVRLTIRKVPRDEIRDRARSDDYPAADSGEDVP